MKDEETKPTENINNKNNENLEIKKKDYKIINIRKNNFNSGNRNSNMHNYENNFKNEIERLENEKINLIKSGSYVENDPLIQKIEMRIKKLYESSGYN